MQPNNRDNDLIICFITLPNLSTIRSLHISVDIIHTKPKRGSSSNSMAWTDISSLLVLISTSSAPVSWLCFRFKLGDCWKTDEIVKRHKSNFFTEWISAKLKSTSHPCTTNISFCIQTRALKETHVIRKSSFNTKRYLRNETFWITIS